MAQNDYDGLLQWLPHDLQLGTHDDHNQTKDEHYFGFGLRRQYYGIKSTQTTLMSADQILNPPSAFPRQGKYSQRPQTQGQRRKSQLNWASGGPGMQAIFLGSSPKCGGTGVFLPRTEATDSQFTKKPAFSPVLLPSRVVQALNLNVHELGQQIKPQPEPQHKLYTSKKFDETKENKNKEDNIRLSPEIYLPKEWTY